MINFFRKTRKKLADDNKPLKYARYAIGEIVLVVVGILIALSINNWNEERSRQQKLRTYMASLTEDLNEDIIIINIWLKNNHYRYNAMQHLLKLSEQEPMKTDYSLIPSNSDGFVPWKGPIPEEYDSIFVESAFLWSTIVGGIKSNLLTLVEIKNNGLYSYINNVEIKDAINTYTSEFERRLGDFENGNIREYRNDWIGSLAKNGYTPDHISDPEEALKWLHDTPEATAHLRNLISNAKWRIDSAEYLLIESQALIQLINNELVKK